MIKINNLVHKYNEENVLDIKHLELQTNSIVGLTGINGCGKSTFLRILSGVFKPSSGDVFVNALSVFENDDVKKNILFISDDPLDNITVKEISNFYILFYNMDITLFEKYLEKFEIKKRGNLASFSKGMRRRVYLAVSLAVRPEILLLDEAFDGLDPLAKKIFKEEIIEIMEEKEMIVVISSHALKDIEDLADELILLKEGRVIFEQHKTSMYKIFVCFNEERKISSFDHYNIIDISGNKKIFTFIVSDLENVTNYLNTFNPYAIETSELTYEEIFLFKNKEVL